jgi:SAM-dependent methyltransferase
MKAAGEPASDDEAVIRGQIAYYRARAGEYDDWFLRRGRYDRGKDVNARWFDQLESVRAELERFAPAGRVLELACGTGLWTERLARHARELTAVDASPETIRVARGRLAAAELTARVRLVEADLFAWRPEREFDVVFFAFWLSHVPPARFDAFWEMVRAALAPGGRVFFVDSLYTPESTARDHRLGAPDDARVTRRLDDGREFEIVKIFHEPAALAERLSALGWRVDVRATPDFFLYGQGGREGPGTLP